MIERVIASLKTPIETLLTNSTIRAYMGSGVAAIPVYIGNMPSETTPPPCWVLLKPMATDAFQKHYQGGQNFTEIVQFQVSAYSLGSTRLEAENRAAQLLLEVMRQVTITLRNVWSSLTRVSLVAPSSTYEKPNFFLVEIPTIQPVTSGPNGPANQYTAERYNLVKIDKYNAIG